MFTTMTHAGKKYAYVLTPAGTYRRVELVGREHQIAGPVAGGGLGDLGHDHLGGAAGLQIAVGIGVADHPIVLGDVDPLRIGPERVEGDAEGLVQALGEGGVDARPLGPVGGAQHADAPGRLLGDEDVAVGRDHHMPRAGHAVGKQRGAEPRRQREAGVVGGAVLGRRGSGEEKCVKDCCDEKLRAHLRPGRVLSPHAYLTT